MEIITLYKNCRSLRRDLKSGASEYGAQFKIYKLLQLPVLIRHLFGKGYFRLRIKEDRTFKIPLLH